ncbi:hypothetical protein Drorol1_Dr00003698 [Drosera rotundifolia]
MVFDPLVSEKRVQERFKRFMRKVQAKKLLVKTLKPTKGIVKKTEGTIQAKDCPKKTKNRAKASPKVTGNQAKASPREPENQAKASPKETSTLLLLLEKRQDIQKRQERQTMREAARLKLQKMEELADYVDNIGVMNDFLRLIGDNSFRYAENSRDNFRFWNRKRHSGLAEHSGFYLTTMSSSSSPPSNDTDADQNPYNVADAAASAEQDAKVARLHQMIGLVWSDDDDSRREGTLPLFVAACVISTIASSENTLAVVKHRAVPNLLKLLHSTVDTNREKAVEALGEIARGDSPDCRETLLSSGAFEVLLPHLSEDAESSMVKIAIRALSKFWSAKPIPSFCQTELVVDVFNV